MQRPAILLTLLLSCGAYAVCRAQDPTLNQGRSGGTRETAAAHRIMIIPFEPKLYMSEIDRSVNAETGMNARQIKHRFRDGINDQLYRAFRASNFGVVDLMEDTARSKKDLEQIYQQLHYEYLRVPDQKQYKAPQQEKGAKSIDKGQLVVETNNDARFMDARLGDKKVLQQMNLRHKTDLFLFINQLDIKASGNKAAGELGEGNPNRRIVVHYTLFNLQGQELNSGTVEEDFDPAINNPKKIVEKHFSRIAQELARRATTAAAAGSK